MNDPDRLYDRLDRAIDSGEITEAEARAEYFDALDEDERDRRDLF